MDKGVKIILGLAIAILFPIFVWFAVYTFIPDPKLSQVEYPKSPEVPSCRNYSSDYSEQYSQRGATITNYNNDCQYQNDRYKQALKDHDKEVKEYEEELREVSKQKDQIVVWRAQFALVLAVFGMLAVMVSTGVVGVAAGLAGGAAATIVIAVSFLIPSLMGDSKVSIELSVILLLACFVLLTAELWYVDNVLYPEEKSNENDLNGTSFSQVEDKAKPSAAAAVSPADPKSTPEPTKTIIKPQPTNSSQLMPGNKPSVPPSDATNSEKG